MIISTESCISDIHLFTKAKDDSKLYLTIDSLVNTLRKEGFKDIDIKNHILKLTEQIIDEQQAYKIFNRIFKQPIKTTQL